jgi:oligopeptide transport system ATP-binding protein
VSPGATPAATPATTAAAVPAATLRLDSLSVSYVRRDGTVDAVREVSLAVRPGECLGIVGESGAGKSQAFMAAMGLLAPNARTGGSVRFEGEEILGLDAAALNRVRGSKLTMIFQDPMTSLTPHLRIGVQLAEVLVSHRGASWAQAERAALHALERVRVSEPKRRLQQYPHELSGGLRQRVMIGMSLLCEPALVIADEPTSALDVTMQAQIIELLRTLRLDAGLSIALISHDLGVVAGLADRVTVMYAGRVVESAGSAELLRAPRHPYTALLLQCVPNLRAPRSARMPSLPGQPPPATSSLRGCAFAPRCPRASELCRAERPMLRPDERAREFACHHPLEP